MWRFKPGVLILMGLAMLTITMIACGADATPVPVIQEKVVTVEVVKEVPVTVVKIQPVEVPQLVTVVATPTPRTRARNPHGQVRWHGYDAYLWSSQRL